ncbi:MAG TPA: hypothetical protein VLK78_04560 [Candidatus Angelobacter sp.]|nr:hypothetical protein [Candidatus Angelobacter sp.]
MMVNLASDDQLDDLLEKLRREEADVSFYPSFAAKRELAQKLIEKGQYCF